MYTPHDWGVCVLLYEFFDIILLTKCRVGRMVAHVIFIQGDVRMNVNQIKQPICKKCVNGIARKERLTITKMRKLFDANYSGVIAYSFDLKKWNTTTYLNYKIPGQLVDTRIAWRMKHEVDCDPRFVGFELVGMAVMLVDGAGVGPRGMLHVMHDPIFSLNGNAIVGTIVVRDVNSGKIVPLSRSWLYVHADNNRAELAQHAAQWFASLMSDSVSAASRRAIFELSR